MDKTAIEVMEVVHQHIENSSLMLDAQKPNGDMYYLQRPEGSVKEDVVINILALTNEPVQEGILNVNIYVPNRIYTLPDQGRDHSMPDTLRMKYLSRLAQDNLKEVWAPDGNWTFTWLHTLPMQDENNQHFINTRLEFFNATLNN